MPTAVALVLVITFSFVVNRLVRTLATRHLILSGAEYLILGLLLGPLASGVLSEEIIRTLAPFVSLVLGLLGFLLGISLRSQLKRAELLEAGLLGSIISLAIVMGVTFGLITLIAPGQSTLDALWPALAIAAGAVVSDRRVVEVGTRLFGARGPVSDLLHSYALASSIVAVVIFGVALALARSRIESGQVGLTEGEWMAASVAVGLACGLLFVVFIGDEDDTQRTFLATVGVVIFASGMAAGMGLSSLFVCSVAGLVVSILSEQASKLEEVLSRLGPPTYTLLLILGGASWHFVGGMEWIIPPVYIAVRVMAIRLGSAIGTRTFPGAPVVPRVGNGLLAQGALSVAIALNFAQVSQEYGALVMTTVFGGLIIGDLWSARKLRETLADAGELGQIDSRIAQGRKARPIPGLDPSIAALPNPEAAQAALESGPGEGSA